MQSKLVKNQICTKCVMDTSDPEIFFNELGLCSHCLKLNENKKWYNQVSNRGGDERLIDLVDSLADTKSVIGISGGADSCFLLHKLYQLGLRPYVVHVDTGWNSVESVRNLSAVLSKMDVDYETIIIDWETMREVQVAFLKSGVINQDIPQDHAIFSSLYNFSLRNRFQNLILGTNFATESVGVQAWGSYAMDGKFVQSIFEAESGKKLTKFPISKIPFDFYSQKVRKKYRIHHPLDLIEYRKDGAIKTLSALYGWRDYGGKHRESTFTAFYQDIFLPIKYGIDKRKMHLSSLIHNGELTRGDAIQVLTTKFHRPNDERNIKDYIARKLQISLDELETYLFPQCVSQQKYRNDMWFLKCVAQLGTVKNKFLSK